MTTCDPPKIRSLIEKHLGSKKAAEYDTIVEQCKLGKALKDERTWAPLCPSFPNLKGVTCEEIDTYTKHRLPSFFSSEKYHVEKDILLAKLDNMAITRGYSREAYDELEKECTEQYKDFIKDNVSTEEYNAFENEFVSEYNTIGLLATFIEFGMRTKERENVSTEYIEDYLRHVRAYDRDEIYDAFKKIGKQIKTDYPGIINDPSTIYVTTPRGGHEMLSIFAYANDIKKNQIPSDICDDIPTNITGNTWLDTPSEKIKTIFIVDDIIASGSQVYRTTSMLRKTFPHAIIKSISLCKRDKPFKKISEDADTPSEYYADTTTIGIEEFDSIREKNKLFDDQYITCIFPHACPKGESDKIMIDVMGKRCSPEKRIARQDL